MRKLTDVYKQQMDLIIKDLVNVILLKGQLMKVLCWSESREGQRGRKGIHSGLQRNFVKRKYEFRRMKSRDYKRVHESEEFIQIQ